MRIKMKDGNIYIEETNSIQFNIIKSFMKWDKKEQRFVGAVSLDLLEKLSKLITLPEIIKAEHERLKAVQDAVDKERVKPDKDVNQLVHYPVRKMILS